MRCFQADLVSSFLRSTYAGHCNLAAAKPGQFMPNCKDGSSVEFIIFSVYNLVSAYVSCHML